jgi:hypothetical protein
VVLPPLLLLLPPQPGDRLGYHFEDQGPACGQSFPAQAPTPLADPFVEAGGWVRSGGPELGGDKLWAIRMLIAGRVACTQPRDLILTSVVLIAGVSGALVKVGTVELKGMALGTVVAIVLGLTFGLIDRFRRLS